MNVKLECRYCTLIVFLNPEMTLAEFIEYQKESTCYIHRTGQHSFFGVID